MYVLGISCFYHDAAASIICDGKLIAAAQEERFSRKKHDFGFPQLAIEFCLKQAGITIDDVALIVFYEKPFQKFDRILMSALATWPKSSEFFRESTMVWLLDKLWTRDIIQERLGCKRDKIVCCHHHLSHAASTYYPSGFDSAAYLTVDGVGEWATGSHGTCYGLDITPVSEMRYPHSIGLLYSAFTAFLGFQVNEGEYKVMGMAPYGKPTFVDTIFDKVVELHEDGSFKLNMDYFAYHYSAYHSFTPLFTEVFGRPRTKEESNLLDPHYANIAASIQKATEIILIKQASYLHRKYGHDNLCMAGGSALNSVANARIFREAGFKHLYIQPAAGDDGASLGAALWGYYHVLGGKERYKQTHCYWGAEYSDEEVKATLREHNQEFKELKDDEELYKEVVSRLTHGQVVGWMQGRFEWGPRALGDRSILADPRFAQMKDVVNARIKFREPFRPFAPSVLADSVEDFFELPNSAEVDPARFMLMVVPVKKERQKEVPAITHVDGTARIQAVYREDNPRYSDLIKRFGEETGVPVVLNTSFNLRGEPIVNTPAEAYSTFLRSDMDALVMGHIIVSRREVADQRQLSETELEKWAHAPTRSDNGKGQAQVPSGGSVAATEAAAIHKRYLEEMAKAQDVGHMGKVGYTVQWILVALVLLCCVEVVLRFTVPMPNMQVRHMYTLTEDERFLELTPNWTGRVHAGEFDVQIALDDKGHRPLPPLPAESDLQRPWQGKKLLAVGDSFTFGCWSDTDKIWLNQIQTATGATVSNLGRPNAGTDTALRLLQSPAYEKDSDLVLLGFYAGNDFYDNMLGEEAFTLNRGYLVLKKEDEVKWSRYNCLDGSGLNGGGSWSPGPLRRLYTYQFFMGLANASQGQRILNPSCAEAWLLKQYTPEMETAVAKTNDYLERIKQTVEASGAKLAVVVIPSAAEVYAQDLHSLAQARGLSDDLFQPHKACALVSDWCRAHNVACLDLYDAFAGQPRSYYLRDMHWNDLGHQRAGIAASSFLLENFTDLASPAEARSGL